MLRERRFFVSAFCFVLFLFLCASTESKKKPPLHPINLNTAGSTQLQEVPGIGPATADKILKMRKSYGPFKSVDDLRAIKGIGPKRLEKMRKYLTVTMPPAKKTTQPAKTTGKTKTPSAPDKSQPEENSSPE
jgi:comEA protein